MNILLEKLSVTLRRLTPTRLLFLGYCTIILIGTILLSLPIATRGEAAPIKDALFTATSATCVTGLVLHDTYFYWSLFGQLVLLVLIEVGGLGFMTVAISALTLTKRKIGLRQRFTMQEAVGAPQVGGIVRMTKFILLAAADIQVIGAISLSFYFCPRLGALKGIYFAVFHAVSAFCNAGIDLMGAFAEGSSLMTACNSILVNLSVMSLIIVGGLGFYVWADLIEHKHRFRQYRLHTKLVLFTTLLLLVGGTLLLFLVNRGSAVMEGVPALRQLQYSLFQSVSARTAGFASIDLAQMSEPGVGVMILLMLVGGSPGSTAGGIKTTTIAVLFLSILVVFRKKKSIECFGRRLEEETVHNAACVLMLYLLLSVGAAIAIAAMEGLPLLACLFETASAVGTVGLSLGLTPTLCTASHLLLILLMFIGRLGGIAILLIFSSNESALPSQYPAEKITVG